MSRREIIEDSLSLYKRCRFHSAFALALISVEATAKVRYPQEEDSRKRFKQFLNDDTQSQRIKMKHAVDMPPLPAVRPCPELALPEDPEADMPAVRAYLDRYNQEFERWQSEHDLAYKSYASRFMDVGDDFCGPKRVYLRERRPRLVTTTGILYQARCELVHEGSLSTIRIVPADSDNRLAVAGADPIEFSSSWINHVLGIVVAAKENRALFERQAET